ncbi:MAG: sigma-70 family RNA polymerase sigma factor, partial [Clostridia bacterium]|nr:sigma-70 family RNA polymerase sigma factor [Clostridia bacterium]
IGTIGLIKGINTFRPDKSSKLSTYISRCIENEVLMYLRSAKKLRNEVSIDESIGVDREGNNMTFSDILTNEDTDVSDIIFEKIEAEKLRRAMKKTLNMNEMNILTWRYGLDGRPRKTQREVAKILGISRSYVSRIEKRCLGKLAAEMEEE